ncbi:hypothetical protein Tco_0943268 [Tanacetum coccineum]
MEKIKKAKPGAHAYLIKKDPKSWSRAFFMIGFGMLFLLDGTSLRLEMAVKHSELMRSREPAHAECGNLQVYHVLIQLL